MISAYQVKGWVYALSRNVACVCSQPICLFYCRIPGVLVAPGGAIFSSTMPANLAGVSFTSFIRLGLGFHWGMNVYVFHQTLCIFSLKICQNRSSNNVHWRCNCIGKSKHFGFNWKLRYSYLLQLRWFSFIRKIPDSKVARTVHTPTRYHGNGCDEFMSGFNFDEK